MAVGRRGKRDLLGDQKIGQPNEETEMTTDPLVIVAAVNGGMQMDRDGARVPISPEQIAEDAAMRRRRGGDRACPRPRRERAQHRRYRRVQRDRPADPWAVRRPHPDH